jgi:propionyl-CoA carboxylase alpha chain
MATTFDSVLIANRGEIAARIAGTCRRLGLRTVAVVSDADRGSLHARVCDEAVFIGGRAPQESYLDIGKLLEAARLTGAQAVHPGYGFLAENPAFAQAVLEAGLIWIGPSPHAMEVMGDKVRARAAMIEAGVPVVPGGQEPSVVGFPLLIKAAAGGGGKGMRIVREASEFEGARAAAMREAASAFGDERVFLERFVERGKHVEVQVLGDTHGQVVHVYERECSVQRRHQKILEEAPSPSVSPQLRERLCEAAVQAARAVDYVGAGTVEFLLAEDGSFYFLEMNTRLQVEHPVTERISGLDLVAEQLRIARGGRVPEVGPPRGHAIEVRLYAEDPEHDYLPQVGEVVDLEAPSGFRFDQGVQIGQAVGLDYDPMLAKLVAWGEDREEARRRLVRALEQLSLLGLKHNRYQLEALLREPDFIEARVHTRWLEGRAYPRPEVPQEARVACLVELLGRGAPRLPGVPLGWRNNRVREAEVAIDGQVLRWSVRGGQLFVDGQPARRRGDQLEYGARARRVRVVPVRGGWWVRWPEGEGLLSQDPRFPDPDAALEKGGLAAPMAGKVVRVEVKPGDPVEEGQVLIVLEAMKMETPLKAPAGGVVQAVRCDVGDIVEGGQVLVDVE